MNGLLGGWILPALVAGLAFISLFAGMTLVGEERRGRQFRRRLARVGQGGQAKGILPVAAQRALAIESPTPRLDRVAARWLPRKELLRARLERTGRNISIGHYLLWMVVTGLAAFGLADLAGLGPVPSTLLGLVAGIGLPHLVIGRMGRKRIGRFTALFPDGIDLMVRALHAGLPITEAMTTVGAEVGDPVGAEFRRIEQALKLGRGLDDELAEVAQRLDTPEFSFFVISLSVQRQTGGNLAETLENLSDILRRRRQMRQKIKAVSAEARTSALILGLMPFAIALLILVTSPGYLVPLVSSEAGIALCVMGGLMLLTGTLIMARLIRFEI